MSLYTFHLFKYMYIYVKLTKLNYLRTTICSDKFLVSIGFLNSYGFSIGKKLTITIKGCHPLQISGH